MSEPSPNRQCLAEGLANLGGGLFQCMPGSGSLTRSAINYQSGAMTRLSGIFSALAVAATLLLFAPLARGASASAGGLPAPDQAMPPGTPQIRETRWRLAAPAAAASP